LLKKDKELEYLLQEASTEDSLARRLVESQVLVDDSSKITFSSLNVASASFGGDPSRQLIFEQGSRAVASLLSEFSNYSLAQKRHFSEMKSKLNKDPHLDLLSDKVPFFQTFSVLR
jgi:hypothetical protein